jgi:branched-chain amino acid transport system ATP-binding protein
MADSLLTVVDAEVRYGLARAVNGTSVKIWRGEITAIVGPNGAGKSSLLKAISALVPLAAGRLEFDGQVINGKSALEIASLGIAHVPEGRRVFAKMSVEDNLRLGGYLLRTEQETVAAMNDVFTAFPRLRERIRQRAGSMSGGEQQMLAIGRAMMSSPRLVMTDEVSQGLAPVIVQDVYRQIAGMARRGTTVLLVEQNARMAFKIASFVYVMEQGRVVASGPTAEVAASEHVRNAYLGVG